MKIKHHEIEMPENEPFKNCKLERKLYADILSNIVSTYADGFVMAINNEWGTGKTTFIKMWQKQLKEEGFQTIYFNAWENDYDNNPLIAILAELESLTNEENKFKQVMESASKFLKNVPYTIFRAGIKSLLWIDIEDLSKKENKAPIELLKEEIQEYTSKKKAIVEFREKLAEFVKQAAKEKPLIFIIDELDRCRPDYAVEVLEKIKHFFSVPGIVFVLSIDKKHLCASIKGFYGSAEIDSVDYLRRFIDLELSLPEPNVDIFTDYLLNYYGFEDYLKKRGNMNDSDDLKNIILFLFKKSNCNLRHQERILAYTRLALCSFKDQQYLFPVLFFLLIFFQHIKSELYKEIINNNTTNQRIADIFSKLFSSIQNENEINITYYLALLLHLRNQNNIASNQESLYYIGSNNEVKTNINFNINNSNYTLAEYFQKLNDEFIGLNLNYLIPKIEITSEMNIK